jgi:predicted nucleotidyltransferase
MLKGNNESKIMLNSPAMVKDSRPDEVVKMSITLDDLRKEREQIKKVAQKHGASNIRVFGSISRGEERPESDIDLLVDFEADRSLFDLVRLKLELEELLGHEVDLVTEKAMHRLIASRVIKEAIPL